MKEQLERRRKTLSLVLRNEEQCYTDARLLFAQISKEHEDANEVVDDIGAIISATEETLRQTFSDAGCIELAMVSQMNAYLDEQRREYREAVVKRDRIVARLKQADEVLKRSAMNKKLFEKTKAKCEWNIALITEKLRAEDDLDLWLQSRDRV